VIVLDKKGQQHKLTMNGSGVKQRSQRSFNAANKISVKQFLMLQKVFFHPVAGARIVAKNVVGKILTVASI